MVCATGIFNSDFSFVMQPVVSSVYGMDSKLHTLYCLVFVTLMNCPTVSFHNWVFMMHLYDNVTCVCYVDARLIVLCDDSLSSWLNLLNALVLQDHVVPLHLVSFVACYFDVVWHELLCHGLWTAVGINAYGCHVGLVTRLWSNLWTMIDAFPICLTQWLDFLQFVDLRMWMDYMRFCSKLDTSWLGLCSQ